jgi:hypothetical protein
MVFLIVAPPDLGDLDLNKVEFTLYHKASCQYELFWLCGS